MATNGVGGLVVRDDTGEVWSVNDLSEEFREILQQRDRLALEQLVRSTVNWKKMPPELLAEMVLLALEVPKYSKPGRPAHEGSLHFYCSLACLVKAELTGMKFKQVWEQDGSGFGGRPAIPKVGGSTIRYTGKQALGTLLGWVSESSDYGTPTYSKRLAMGRFEILETIEKVLRAARIGHSKKKRDDALAILEKFGLDDSILSVLDRYRRQLSANTDSEEKRHI